MKKTPYAKNYTKLSPELHVAIARLYASGNYTTEYLAQTYSVSTKQIQRIATKHGVIRTQAQSNKAMAPHKRYHKLDPSLKVKRKQLSSKLRYEVLGDNPVCTHCNADRTSGYRLEVDHIDNNPTNNELSNLQVLCEACNRGKSHLDRFNS